MVIILQNKLNKVKGNRKEWEKGNDTLKSLQI